jgi:Uma2 family endonuclease
MTATAIQTMPLEKQVKPKRQITLEAFHRQYADREDGYRYEWNNGIVEKTPRFTMQRSQIRIAQILTRAFMHTFAYKAMGELAWEVPMFLPKANRNRIADLAYLTEAQVKEQDDLHSSVSSFVIEVISKNDTADDIQLKLEQYFADGVQVVWQIFPKLKSVHVFTSPVDVKICRGAAICSASPALPDFEIAAQDVFL